MMGNVTAPDKGGASPSEEAVCVKGQMEINSPGLLRGILAPDQTVTVHFSLV